MIRRNRIITLMLAVIFLLPACDITSTPTPTPVVVEDIVPLVSVTGKVVPDVWTIVGAQSGGLVDAVLIEEGDDVGPDDVLVRLDDTDARLAVLQAEAAIESAQARVAQVQVTPRPEDIAVAEAQVVVATHVISQAIAQRNQLFSGAKEAEIAAAEAAVAAAEAEQRVAREQHDQTMKCHTVTKPDGSTEEICPALGTLEEQARYALNAANESLAAAQARLEAVRSGFGMDAYVAQTAIDVAVAQRDVAEAQVETLKVEPRPEDVAVMEAAVQDAQLALEAAYVALARMEISPPFSGTVGMVHVRAGEFIAPGQPIATIGDLTTLCVETTDLDEIDVAQVYVGQEATITFDALPDRAFTGRVRRIATMADPGGGGVNYTVILDVEELDPLIRWGMTAFIDLKVTE